MNRNYDHSFNDLMFKFRVSDRTMRSIVKTLNPERKKKKFSFYYDFSDFKEIHDRRMKNLHRTDGEVI